jgi:UDP-glucose 4-epimerase
MDFVHVQDIARANLLAAVSTASDQVFNVASGVETSLDDLARALLKVMGSPLEPEYGPERKVNAVRRRLADTSAAREQIGFSAEIGLEEGLAGLVRWWRGQRAAVTAPVTSVQA